MEDVKFTLQNLNNFVQPQILHLFKEILIGYELLVNIFGFFVVTDKMIVLNNNNQWKVWIN